MLLKFLCREDCVYTTVYNGRNDTRLSDSVGMFVHTLPVVCKPRPGETGKSFTGRIGRELSDSMANDIFSFAEISRDFGVRADVLFVYEGAIGMGFTVGGKSAEQIELSKPNALKAALTFFVYDTEDGYRIECEFETAHYEEWDMGELWIAGYGVGRGYLNLPERTEKVFTLNPFCAEPGFDRVFRTGDMVRRLGDGRIDFIGRNDGQVKIRGFRIELAEVEGVIREYAGIRDVTVQAFEDEAFGGKYIAAYVVSDAVVDSGLLADFIRSKKPAYMVPAAFMQLDCIPLNQNQKVNKRALPKPERREESRDFVEPATPLEREICAEYAAILGLERVGATDSFFEIGGSSISAAEVVMFAMNKGYNIVYKDVFANPSPRELARAIIGMGKDGKAGAAADFDYTAINRLIAVNSMEHIEEISARPLENVILTGATGFLGIHVLNAFLQNCGGTITCLMRRGCYETAERRLISMLMYYFGENMAGLFGKRIFCVEGDITDPDSLRSLEGLDAGTVINCAACVKHFAQDDILDRINVQGVENLIDLCVRSSKRLVQISTLSVAGEMEIGKGTSLKESMLYFGQNVENDYVRTKFLAERAILDARVKRGLDAVILRAGNLMGRNTDGEFQINFESNSFMRSLWAYI